MITIAQTKSLATVIALAAGMSVASISIVTPVEAQSTSEAQAAASLSVVMEFLAIPRLTKLKGMGW